MNKKPTLEQALKVIVLLKRCNANQRRIIELLKQERDNHSCVMIMGGYHEN